jgi:putative transposase
MPRSKRIAKGNIVYHIINRANGRLKIFKKPDDFIVFEQVLAEAVEQFSMRLCGYCIMSNHWHLVLWPRRDGDLSAFMKWLTMTHSHRWHKSHGTVGIGHLYQGRYKSFPVQGGAYYLTLMQYVESNPLRAGLVKCSRDWPYGSLAIRTGADKPIRLSDGPIVLPKRWQVLVDGFDPAKSGEIITCIRRGRPMGDPKWTQKTAKALLLESSLHPNGRPRKEKQK